MFAVLLVLAAACSSGGGSGASGAASSTDTPTAGQAPVAASYDSATKRGEFAVGETTLDLVDTSRPTPRNRSFGGSSERKLKTLVWYPAQGAGGKDAAVDGSAGPYPLIIFAHGLSGSSGQSTSYTKHLASHGYVVAAPDFPLSSGGAPGGPTIADIGNQPKDVSFIIDRILAFNGQDGHLLRGAVDGSRIGMTGHSLGAFTTLLTVYGGLRDDRIRAAAPLSGSGCFMTPDTVGGTSVPVMLMIGSEDLLVAPAGNRRAYDLVNAPRYWVELVGGNHLRFADIDVEDAPFLAALDRLLGRSSSDSTPSSSDGTPQAGSGTLGACGQRGQGTGIPTIKLDRQQELLRAFATPFFDAYLRGSEDAKKFLDDDLSSLTKDAARYEFQLP